MRRHATDMVSLVFGIVFLIFAGWWLITRYVHIQIPHLGWIAAAALIAIGALGIVGSLRGERPAKPAQTLPEPPAPTATGDPVDDVTDDVTDDREESDTRTF